MKKKKKQVTKKINAVYKLSKNTWLLKHNYKVPKDIDLNNEKIQKIIIHYKKKYPNMPYVDLFYIIRNYKCNSGLIESSHYVLRALARHKYTNYEKVYMNNHSGAKNFYNKEADQIIKTWHKK